MESLPRGWWRRPLLIALAARVLAIAGLLAGDVWLRPARHLGNYPDLPLLHDAWWYSSIVVHGYHAQALAGLSNAAFHDFAFLPLWPLLLRLVSWPFGSDPVMVGWIGALVASVLSVLGVLLVYQLFWRRYGPRSARGAYLVALVPAAFVGSLAYGEPLAICLLAIWWSPGLRAIPRALTGFGLGILRLQAAMLALEALPNLWAAARRSWTALWNELRGASRTIVSGSGGIVVGLGLYVLLCAVVTGQPLGVIDGAPRWLSVPGRGVWPLFFGPDSAFSSFLLGEGALLNIFQVTMVGVGAGLLLRRGRSGDAAVVIGLLVLTILTGVWISWGRYVWLALPAFAALGERLADRHLRWLALFCAVLLFTSALYASSSTFPF